MKRAFLFVIVACMLWGTSGIFVHFLSPYGFTALQMTAVRGVISFFVMAGFALLFDRRQFRIGGFRELLLYIFMGATLFGTAFCYFRSMQMTSVSTAVVLMYISPIYILLFSVLVFHERLGWIKGLSVAGILLGCILTSGIIGGGRFNLPGVLIGVLSGVSYAIYNILAKLSVRRGGSPIKSTMYAFLFMAIIALIPSRPDLAVSYIAEKPVPTVPLLIGLGLCTCVIPYFLFNSSLKTLPSGTASAMSIIEPLSASIFSFTLLGEDPDAFSIAGIVLILGCVIVLERSELKKNPEGTPAEPSEQI
ncbi:MAG: EamA family transporter [Clostridia bacterium]|nr:EamA family transporter [Clostridia bacterium]